MFPHFEWQLSREQFHVLLLVRSRKNTHRKTARTFHNTNTHKITEKDDDERQLTGGAHKEKHATATDTERQRRSKAFAASRGGTHTHTPSHADDGLMGKRYGGDHRIGLATIELKLFVRCVWTELQLNRRVRLKPTQKFDSCC